MFEILKEWDARLYERYLTVERNIKAKSNSFYDAYLDLQEQFLVYVLGREGVTFEGRKTCGELLRQDATRAVFCDKMGLLLEDYNKMGDYVLKVNAHKHKGEKHVQLETVLSYMRLFHTVLTRVVATWGQEIPSFDEEYFCNKFAAFEKENRLLWEQLNALKAELETYASQGMAESERQAYDALADRAVVEGLSAEEQNQELLRQIACLKDIKLGILSRLTSLEAGQREILQAIHGVADKQETTLHSIREARPVERVEAQVTVPEPMTVVEYAGTAKQSFIWFGTPEHFHHERAVCLGFIAGLIGLFLIATTVVCMAFEFYTTYTMFENIYLIFTLLMLGQVYRAKRVYDVQTFSTHSMFLFARNREKIWCKGKRKKRYMVFLVLSCISSLLNIFCAGLDDIRMETLYIVLVTVVELAVVVLTIMTYIKVVTFFENYNMVLLESRTLRADAPRALVYEVHTRDIYTKEEFISKFPRLKFR